MIEYVINPKIKIRRESEDKFLVYVPQYRNLVFINSTGLFIIRNMKRNKNTNEIMHEMVKNYSISIDTAQKDLQDFLKICEENNIVYRKYKRI